MKIRLGDIVELPSGARGQVEELLTYWKKKYIGERWITERTKATVHLRDGRRVKIADYQLTRISSMPCAGG